MKTIKHGEAYKAVRHIYDSSPGRSWLRLNGALHDTLSAAITAHLSFEIDDFIAIHNDMMGSYWMGNSAGATCGERYYGLAVHVGHTPACMAFEKYANRPAALWSEKVKTPSRLRIGSEFTWEGMLVSVTNLNESRLVACHYAQENNHHEELRVGSYVYSDGRRNVEYLKRVDDGSLLLGLSAEVGEPSSRPDRIFTIEYGELAAKRKTYEAARKSALRQIAAAATPAELDIIQSELAAQPRHTYRHFDIEEFRDAIAKRTKDFDQEEVESLRKANESIRMERWLAGSDHVGYLGEVRLRIKGAYVETSTGHSVTVQSARTILPWVMRHRRVVDSAFEPRKIDLHEIRSFTEAGVQIGCTLVPWTEIERLRPLLKATA